MDEKIDLQTNPLTCWEPTLYLYSDFRECAKVLNRGGSPIELIEYHESELSQDVDYFIKQNKKHEGMLSELDFQMEAMCADQTKEGRKLLERGGKTGKSLEEFIWETMVSENLVSNDPKNILKRIPETYLYHLAFIEGTTCPPGYISEMKDITKFLRNQKIGYLLMAEGYWAEDLTDEELDKIWPNEEKSITELHLIGAYDEIKKERYFSPDFKHELRKIC